MTGDARELFRSENLIVRAIAGASNFNWVVTFDNFGLGRAFDRPGFGQEFLAGQGISAIHVIPRGNDWYQYPEIPKALAAVRGVVAGRGRVMTYGSSMGGYAAIRFADAVLAKATLAYSPQYSIDPAKMPGEWRWPQEANSIAWNDSTDGKIACSTRPVIVFDPSMIDSQHVRAIAAETEILPIPLPYTGHPVTTYLSDAGLLTRVFREVFDDVLDPVPLQNEALARRKSSSVYYIELARRQPAARLKTAVALARIAVRLSPESSLAQHTLARRLTLAGEHTEALPLHAHAVARSDGHMGYLFPYSEALFAAGDRAGC